MPNSVDRWPRRVLVVGCGLIGSSFALAIRRAGVRIDGVDVNPSHRETARRMGAVDCARASWEDLPASRYDLAVLAIPVDAAILALQAVAGFADVVMDVCSVKAPVCEAADAHGLRDRFAPTHPMAGLASSGPGAACPSLFEGQSWLLLEGWPACERVQPLVAATGARPVWVDSAASHDAAMAAVSHAIHLTSVAAMLAYEDARRRDGEDADWAPLSGPGFRDVTRLAGAPSGFWVSTLLANRGPVADQARRVASWLERFAGALERNDAGELERMLTEAHTARMRWERERDKL